MEDYVKVETEIKRLFDLFTQQEIGNRLSEFALISFRTMVLNEIAKLNHIPLKEESLT